MSEAVIPLPQRLAAYRRIVKNDPGLSAQQREHLFTLAVWPEETSRAKRCLTWEHFQNCRTKGCRLCAEGELEPSLAA